MYDLIIMGELGRRFTPIVTLKVYVLLLQFIDTGFKIMFMLASTRDSEITFLVINMFQSVFSSTFLKYRSPHGYLLIYG